MSVEQQFGPPREAVRWAEGALSEYRPAVDLFFQKKNAELVAVFDRETGESVRKLRLRARLPSNLKRKATEALLNARHAFDQAAFAARNHTTGYSSKDVFFPWARNPRDLDFLLEERGFDQRLWDVFRSHEPYPASDNYTGGNSAIRALATLANTKHTVGLTINAHLSTLSYPSFGGKQTEAFGLMFPNWDSLKNEVELYRWIGEIETHGKYQVGFEILLEDAKLPHPRNATGALSDFTEKAKAVVESLSTRCLELRD